MRNGNCARPTMPTRGAIKDMPRYFLNVTCGTRRVLDKTGIDISFSDLLLSEISRAVDSLKAEQGDLDLSGCTIEVVDSSGNMLMRVDLDNLDLH
jgi:hypothetical protein